MAIPNQRRPLRGVSDLRTLNGRSNAPISPHKAFLRISFLELERTRRLQEARTCHDRCEAIRERFREIDAEVAAIRARLEAEVGVTQAPATAPPRSAPAAGRPTAKRFQLAY
jgi:hypothetical protein